MADDGPVPAGPREGKVGDGNGNGNGGKRFSILVCIDGSDEALRGLRYAARLGSGNDADLTLLYVRPVDQGLRTAGLQASVARENLLDWGLELPGMKALRKAREVLVDVGYLAEDWEQEFRHTDVRGDPLGDNMVVYTNDSGRSITLKLIVAPSIAIGILDEAEAGGYDITIVAKSDSEEGSGLGFITPDVALTIAIEHTGTVLVARLLEESHGHLVCVTDAPESIIAARRDAVIAARCACPIHLFSVAETEGELAAAEAAIAKAEAAIAEVGVKISGKQAVIGNPVETIVEEGRKYSLIVMSGARKRSRWRRFFTFSTAYKVLEHAHNSVMIAR